jgi:Ulp1 family protease
MVKVPEQPNGKDCGCFTIFFAKKFLSDPNTTMAIVKVVLFISSTELN